MLPARLVSLVALAAAALCAHADFRPALARLELDRGRVLPGTAVRATYTFLANEPADRQLMVFVHLIPLGEGFQIGGDFQPGLPTSSWPAGAFVRETHPIPIPANAAPGRYRVALGLYDRYNGPRIELANSDRSLGDYRYAVGEIDVLAPGAEAPAEPVAFEVLPVDESRLRDRSLMQRAEPTDPVVLRSDALRVVLDRADALPVAYELPDGVRLPGEPAGLRPSIVLFRSAPRGTVACEAGATSVHASDTEAAFRFEVAYEGTPAVAFVLRYRLEASTLSVTLEETSEQPGYELIEARLAALASVRADGPA